MKLETLIGGVLAAAIALAPAAALAQAHGAAKGHDAMAGEAKGHDMAGHGAAMSEADKTKMASCNAMSHADAAKDAKCAELMKAHPDMMHHMPAKHGM